MHTPKQPRKILAPALGLVALAVLPGCGGGAATRLTDGRFGSFSVTATTGAVPADFSGYDTPLDTPPAVTPKTAYAAGENVTMVFVLRNTSGQTRTLYYTRATLNLQVRAAGGTLVYDSSPDYADPGPSAVLKPGQYFVDRVGWDQKDRTGAAVSKGTYTVSGVIAAGYDGTNPAPTSVTIQ